MRPPPAPVLLRVSLGLLLVGAAKAEASEGKDYLFTLLVRPPTRPSFPAEELADMQALHVGNLGRLQAEGINRLAGPFGDGGRLRGIAVLDREDPAALARDFAPDPFVEHGLLTLEPLRFRLRAGTFRPAREPGELGSYYLAFLCKEADQEAEDATLAAEALMDELVGESPDDQSLIGIAGIVRGHARYAGILVLRCAEEKAARELLLDQADVKAGLLQVELHPLYLWKGIIDRPLHDPKGAPH